MVGADYISYNPVHAISYSQCVRSQSIVENTGFRKHHAGLQKRW